MGGETARRRTSCGIHLAIVLMLLGLVPGVSAAIVNVTTTADTVAGVDVSLRDAFNTANTDGMDTEIHLSVGLTYALDLCGATEDANANGDLDHTEGNTLTIFGNGSTIEQTCSDERVIHGLLEAAELILDDVTVTGGDPGGGLDGGGVNSAGRLVLQNDTVVTGNTTGGGVFVGVVDAVLVPGLLEIRDSTVSLNSPYGAEINEGGALVEDSLLIDNFGPGLRPVCSTVEINRTVASGNMDRGIAGVDSPLTITESTISGNMVGGVRTTSPGLAGLELALIRSTVSDNAGNGVDCSDCEPMRIENSTISGNATGVNADLNTVTDLIHATVVDNTTANVTTSAGLLTTFGSVIALVDGGSDCVLGGGITSDGYNFDGDGSCGLAGVGDQSAGGDPLLDPLAANGGPTLTHMPALGSPLLNVIPVMDCVLATDQRGISRPRQSGCDVGAVERTNSLLVALESFSAERVGDAVRVRWTTTSEIDNAGFRLLRETPGRGEKSPRPLQTVAARGSALAGASYEILDTAKPAAGEVRYYLEDVDLWGRVTRHGPVRVEPAHKIRKR